VEYGRKGPKYNLDESLFERLANSSFGDRDVNGYEGEKERGEGRFPIAQLNQQRRMHPMISTLVRETLYPRLQDHIDTKSYSEVAGIKRRLFWLDHSNNEDAGDPEEPMQSKTNPWEATMVTALVRHLCRQGKYKRGEIAVLTPYVGQLRILRDLLEKEVDLIIAEKDLEDLDASDVDMDKGDNNNKRNRPLQQILKGNLLDQLRMAAVDNFQVRELATCFVLGNQVLTLLSW
jgi:superfamily I DNA and/or RNA helicase